MLHCRGISHGSCGGGNVNLDDVMTAHVEWKLALRNAINTQTRIDVAAILNHEICLIGKWLAAEGKEKYGHLPSFANLLAAHAGFHNEAARVARIANLGDYKEAYKMIDRGTPFGRCSLDLCTSLMAVRVECAGVIGQGMEKDFGQTLV
jgi:hypothetical protein